MPEKNRIRKIEWKGFLSVNDAETIKEELLEQLSLSPEITVDISKLEDIDISILQLIFSIEKEAREQNKTIIVKGLISEGVKHCFHVCGFSVNKYQSNEEILKSLQDRVRGAI